MGDAELERIWRVGLEDISALSIGRAGTVLPRQFLPILESVETIHFSLRLRADGQGALGRLARTPASLHLRVWHGSLLEASAGSFLRPVSEVWRFTRATMDQRTGGTLFGDQQK